MICIEKEPVMKIVSMLEQMLKTTKVSKAIQKDFIELVRMKLDGLPVIDTEYVDPDTFVTPKTDMVEELEPLIPYGSIGKPNYYCGNCKTRVKQKDHYCRRCGYTFRGKEEKDA